MRQAVIAALGIALVAAPAHAQECIGRGLLGGGGAWSVRGGLVAGEPLLGADVAAVRPGPWSWLAAAEVAFPDSGIGLHLGGRALLETGAGPCVSGGLSYYYSSRDWPELSGSLRFRILAPSAGVAVGKAIPHGAWIINPFISAEGHLIFKAEAYPGSQSGGWSGWSNEGRAVVAVGVGAQRRAFFLAAAVVLYPGTASIVEAARGTPEAGGSSAGLEVAFGRTF